MVDCTCEQCGKIFPTWPAEVARGGGRHCSTKCYGEARTTKELRECLICGGSFYAHQCEIKRGWGNYCSPGCFHKAHPEMVSGEKNWNWKGGITPAYMKARNSKSYLKWRSIVYSRDNFICQDCGDHNYKGRGGAIKLHAHHIFSFADFPEHRFEPWNGVTLCEPCHMKTHFGVKNMETTH